MLGIHITNSFVSFEHKQDYYTVIPNALVFLIVLNSFEKTSYLLLPGVNVLICLPYFMYMQAYVFDVKAILNKFIV